VEDLQVQLRQHQQKFQQEIGQERSLKVQAEEEIKSQVTALAAAEAKFAEVQKALKEEEAQRDQRAMAGANRALKQRMAQRKQELDAAVVLQQAAKKESDAAAVLEQAVKKASVSGASGEPAPGDAVQQLNSQLSLAVVGEKVEKEAAQARTADLLEEVRALKARLQARSTGAAAAGSEGGDSVATSAEVAVLEEEVVGVREKMKGMREEQQQQLAALRQELQEAKLASAAPHLSAGAGMNQSTVDLGQVQVLDLSTSVSVPNSSTGPASVQEVIQQRQLQQEEASNDVLVAQELARQTVELAKQTRADADAAAATAQAAEEERAEVEALAVAKEEEIKEAALGVASNKQEKKDNKAKIKAWLGAFREKEGREPTNEDKNAIRPLYLEHKRMEDAMKKLETDLTSANLALAQMKSEAEAKAKADEEAKAKAAEAEANAVKAETERKMKDEEAKAAAEQAAQQQQAANNAAAAAAAAAQAQPQAADAGAGSSPPLSAAGSAISLTPSASAASLASAGGAQLSAAQLAELESVREESHQRAVDLDEKQVEVDEAKETIDSLKEQLAALHQSMEEDAGFEEEDDEAPVLGDDGDDEGTEEETKTETETEEDRESRKDLELQLKLATAEAAKAKSELKTLQDKTAKAAAAPASDGKEAKKLEAKAVAMLKEGIAKGMKSWPARKGECRDVYLKLVQELEAFLPAGTRGFTHLKKAATFASTQKAGGAAVTLKRELEKFRQLLEGNHARGGAGTATASKRKEGETKAKEAKATAAAHAQEAQAKKKMEALQQQLEEAKAKAPHRSPRGKASSSGEDHGGGKSPRGAGGNKAVKAALARAKAAEKRAHQLEAKLSESRKELRLAQDDVRQGSGAASGGAGHGGQSSAADRRKIRELEKEVEKLHKMKTSGSSHGLATSPTGKSKAGSSRDLHGGRGRGGGSGGGSDAASEAKIKGLERRLAENEKKTKKAADEAEKKMGAAVKKVQREAGGASKKLALAEEENKTLEEQKKKLKTKVKELEEMTKDLGALKERAAAADIAEEELKESKKEVAKLEVSYKQEQTLRKKYYNIIEDMKGKIRVYCRCRPMARYELENGSTPVVTFVDETTLDLKTARGAREFLYDQVPNLLIAHSTNIHSSYSSCTTRC
jgi:hypothetical protein